MATLARKCLLLFAVAGLAFWWCAQATAQTEPPAGAGPATLNADEVSFLQQAVVIGMAEMQAAAIAARRATNDDSRAFANAMRTDHGAANDQLQLLAARKTVVLTPEMDQPQLDMLAELEGADATQFDTLYAKHMVRGHEAAIALYSGAASKSQDRELQEFLRVSLPVLKHHLQMAQQLKAD